MLAFLEGKATKTVRSIEPQLTYQMHQLIVDGYQDSLTELGKEMTEISSVITEIVIK